MADDLLLLRVSGHGRQDLLRRLDALTNFTEGPAPPASDGTCRAAIVAPAHALRARLALARERIAAVDRPRFAMRSQGIYFGEDCDPGKIALLFPGQGSQHAGMLRELYDRLAIVRDWFDALDSAAVRAGEPPLTELIYVKGTAAATLYDLHRGPQLGTAAGVALHQLLESFGVQPDFVIGHSNGEHAAVIAAGMIPGLGRGLLCDSFVRAGTLTASLPLPEVPEQMAAVSAISREQVQILVSNYPGDCFLAMDNCPHQLVVAGHSAAMNALRRDVLAAGGVWGGLPFTRAYHTPLFADWGSALSRWYAELPFTAARVPVYSCSTASPLPGEPDQARDAIAHQWTSVVRFRDTIEAVYSAGARTFIEVGPDNKLTAFTDDVLRGRHHVAVSMLSQHGGDIAQLKHLAAELSTIGIALDLSSLAARRGHWRAAAAAVHQRLTVRAEESVARVRELLATHREEHRFTRETHSWLDDHAFGRGARRFPILPFTMSMALAAAAAERLTGRPVTELTNVRAHRWLAADRDSIVVRVEARRKGDAVAVALNDAFAAEARSAEAAPHYLEAGGAGRAPRLWTVERFYRDYAFHGARYQTVFEVTSVSKDGIEAELIARAPLAPMPGTPLPFDPALLDAAGQMVAFWLLEYAGREPSFGIFPFAACRVVLPSTPLPAGGRARCRATIRMTAVGTSADFEFRSEDGRLLAAIEGFEQRLVEFPPAVAETIFRGNAAPLDDSDLAFLHGSAGAFGRAVAYLTDKIVAA